MKNIILALLLMLPISVSAEHQALVIVLDSYVNFQNNFTNYIKPNIPEGYYDETKMPIIYHTLNADGCYIYAIDPDQIEEVAKKIEREVQICESIITNPNYDGRQRNRIVYSDQKGSSA